MFYKRWLRSPRPAVLVDGEVEEAMRVPASVNLVMVSPTPYVQNGAGLRVEEPALLTHREYPDELVVLMEAEPAVRDAFERLTPGRRRCRTVIGAPCPTASLDTAESMRFRVALRGGGRWLCGWRSVDVSFR